jgi:radical SAM superfamily enzyme YgiQ (UPF0313 family)
MKPLKIYLGDLTHDTIVVSTEAFPLNIGYITAYCKKRFGDAVDITLFKYISELEKAIKESPPDILGLSNYCWNQRIGLEMFLLATKHNPHVLRVWGGPNFPLDLPSQKEFLKKYPQVDVYVPVEGESGFSNIVEIALKAESKEKIRELVMSKPIDGCMIRGPTGNVMFTIAAARIRNLDEIPSPYQTGLLDKFFDGKLTPMLQTNRGCPFSCTFCVDGTDLVKQVNQFGMQRVTDDLNYIAPRVPKNVHSLHISDLNFGMIPRDLEICRKIAEIKAKYGYPLNVLATTGKNSKERIIDAVKMLDGALRFTMSVQSMDQEVLRNIRRDNISVEHMLALGPTIKEAKLSTASEVILGLPGETYTSHIQTLRDLVRAKLDSIQIYTCMILPGSELYTPQERKKWGLKTKFRVLPRDFTKLESGKNVIEIEECVVSSNSLAFDEYVELRMLAFSIGMTSNGGIYSALLKFLREQNLDVFELFLQTVKRLKTAHPSVQHVFDLYKTATMNELWDSPEEIEQHYQDDKEYQKLVNQEVGMNVMQFHNALVTAEYMNEWTEYMLDISYSLLKELPTFGDESYYQFQSVSNYIRGICYNVLKRDRMYTNPEFTFDYDVQKWLDDPQEQSLINFKLPSKAKVSFRLTEQQFKLVEDELDIHGDNSTGRGQVIKRVPINMLLRQPVVIG